MAAFDYLFDHQVKSIHDMYDIYKRGEKFCILGDKVGSGKTVTTLSFLNYVKYKKDYKSLPQLIVLVSRNTMGIRYNNIFWRKNK